jgi:hypothetical protein
MAKTIASLDQRLTCEHARELVGMADRGELPQATLALLALAYLEMGNSPAVTRKASDILGIGKEMDALLEELPDRGGSAIQEIGRLTQEREYTEAEHAQFARAAADARAAHPKA